MNQLAQAIIRRAQQPGVFKTDIPELILMRMDTNSVGRHSMVFEPCVYIVAQGRKQAYLADELYVYDALNFLVLSVPLPLETEVIMASPESPYLGLKLDINPGVLAELVHEMGGLAAETKEGVERGLFVSAMGEELHNCVLRLIKSLDDRASTKIVAPLIIREVLFHILRSEQGGKLRAFLHRDRNDYRISSVIKYIQENYANPIDVQQLASVAGMSASSFHHYFKVVTNASPLQYIKSMRLHAAKNKILLNSLAVSDAAFQVGYASPSQFSREYKRLFGVAPSLDVEVGRGARV